MKRVYQSLVESDLNNYRQMVFITGPRQVGKTSLSKKIGETYSCRYLNWDLLEDRNKLLGGVAALTDNFPDWPSSKRLFIFDEIHKHKGWKSLLKGYYDHLETKFDFIVTGSAKLDVYRRGGDSMMGRYFLYRMHPISVAECLHSESSDQTLQAPKAISNDDWDALLNYGGFPEPFLARDTRFYTRWQKSRFQQLFQEDIRDLTHVHEVSKLSLLAEMLRLQVGGNAIYSNLAKKIQSSEPTIKRWMDILDSVYYSYRIKPWSKNISRSLIKEPKVYLWDWSLVKDPAARYENFIASHLLKAVNFWTDTGKGEYELYYIRDKDKREVDFVIVENGEPWMLIEVKSSKKAKLSPALKHFANTLNVKHAFQLAFDEDYIDQSCFTATEPVIVPAKTFLSQLV